jgi:hypothetical protein
MFVPRKTVAELVAEAKQWIENLSLESLRAELLIERKGVQAAIEYFRLFARSADRLANFRTAFGQDMAVFEREFVAHVRP